MGQWALHTQVSNSPLSTISSLIPWSTKPRRQYDEDGSCGIIKEEFGQMLMDLDGMEEVPERDRNAYIDVEFKKVSRKA